MSVCMYVRTYVCMYLCLHRLHYHDHVQAWSAQTRAISCTSFRLVHSHPIACMHACMCCRDTAALLEQIDRSIADSRVLAVEHPHTDSTTLPLPSPTQAGLFSTTRTKVCCCIRVLARNMSFRYCGSTVANHLCSDWWSGGGGPLCILADHRHGELVY